MADINKVKKINGKDIVVDWNNVDNKPEDIVIEKNLEKYAKKSEIPIVDTELNETSSNAISNSAVAAKFNEEIGDINAALEEIIAIQEDHMTPDGNEVAY